MVRWNSAQLDLAHHWNDLKIQLRKIASNHQETVGLNPKAHSTIGYRDLKHRTDTDIVLLCIVDCIILFNYLLIFLIIIYRKLLLLLGDFVWNFFEDFLFSCIKKELDSNLQLFPPYTLRCIFIGFVKFLSFGPWNRSKGSLDFS